MQKINLIAQSVLELSHRENSHNDDDHDENDDDNDDVNNSVCIPSGTKTYISEVNSLT